MMPAASRACCWPTSPFAISMAVPSSFRPCGGWECCAGGDWAGEPGHTEQEGERCG